MDNLKMIHNILINIFRLLFSLKRAYNILRRFKGFGGISSCDLNQNKNAPLTMILKGSKMKILRGQLRHGIRANACWIFQSVRLS